MAKSADIDRIFAHIGLADMKYHEFEPAPDTDQARQSWSLLRSATTPAGESELPPDSDAPRPEQRAEAFRERVAERVVRHATAEPDPDTRQVQAERSAEPRGGQASGRPLQQIFSRLSGRAEPPPGPREREEQQRTTPLSQVFKRLT